MLEARFGLFDMRRRVAVPLQAEPDCGDTLVELRRCRRGQHRSLCLIAYWGVRKAGQVMQPQHSSECICAQLQDDEYDLRVVVACLRMFAESRY